MLQQPLGIPTDEVELMARALLVHRAIILHGVRFRQLVKELVKDPGFRDRAVEKLISGEQHLVQQHISRAVQKREGISVGLAELRSSIGRKRFAGRGAVFSQLGHGKLLLHLNPGAHV